VHLRTPVEGFPLEPDGLLCYHDARFGPSEGARRPPGGTCRGVPDAWRGLMRAAKIVEKGVVEVLELDMPAPGPGEALLRVSFCGICGSDLHAYRGAWTPDRTPGHEFCAVVEAVGPGVSGIAPGARVTAECFAHCGACEPCERGDYNLCESRTFFPGRPAGGIAERIVYPAACLFVVPDGMSDEQACVVEPTAVAFRAVARGGVKAGDSVVVIGAGTIGLLCAAVASARGAARVLLLAKHPHQADKARQLAIAEPLLPQDGNPQQVVKDRIGAADVVIDCAASGTSLSVALALAARGGRVVEVGGVTRPLMVALNPLVDRELHVTGSSCYGTTDGRPDFAWAIDLIAQGQVKAEALITHTFPLGRVAEAFQTAADKKTGSIKVLVKLPQ